MFDILCPDCNEKIGSVTREENKRTIVLNMACVSEYNSLFECQFCHTEYAVNIEFTERVVTEKESPLKIG